MYVSWSIMYLCMYNNTYMCFRVYMYLCAYLYILKREICLHLDYVHLHMNLYVHMQVFVYAGDI